MKQIKGRNYYISLGYIDPEKRKLSKGIDAKDIQNIFVNCKNIAMYFDNTDPENIIAFTLVPVNEIQRKGNTFKFRCIVNPNDLREAGSDDNIIPDYKKINVIGLFSEYKKDGKQIIKHVSFYETETTLWKNNPSITFSVEAPVDKILGE